MAAYRTHTHDTNPEIRIKPKQPGELDDNRIPIFDHRGRRRGHVGRLASEPTVNRFGVANAKLGTRDGRPAWIGGKPSSANRSGTTDAKHAAQVAQAKGSVSKNPTAPVTHARPKR